MYCSGRAAAVSLKNSSKDFIVNASADVYPTRAQHEVRGATDYTARSMPAWQLHGVSLRRSESGTTVGAPGASEGLLLARPGLLAEPRRSGALTVRLLRRRT